LGLEVGVVLALGLVAVQASGALGRVNAHAALTHYTPPARPAWTPTALIRLLEPLGDPHVHSPSEIALTAAVPPGVHLLVTPMPVLPIVPPTGALPPAGTAHATGIVMPTLGVDAPILHGVDAETLTRGVGHYAGSANPGDVGNVVLAGHNDVYGEVFRDLADLQAGDEITLYTASAAYRYVVRGWSIVEPSDVSVLEPTATPTLTLVSCYPYRIDTQRIIVVADLVGG
jgi:sortase A